MGTSPGRFLADAPGAERLEVFTKLPALPEHLGPSELEATVCAGGEGMASPVVGAGQGGAAAIAPGSPLSESADLITIDVTQVPEARPGDMVDLIGPHHDVDALAEEAGTIGYEILTSLGRRYRRRYLGGGEGA